jgi:hypothetical protein
VALKGLVGKEAATEESDSLNKRHKNTARIDRIPIDTQICRNFSRSILHSTIACGDGFIDRSV